MHRHNFIRKRRSEKLRAHKTEATFTQALEALFYELKPIAYLVFAIAVLRIDLLSMMWVKYSAVFRGGVCI